MTMALTLIRPVATRIVIHLASMCIVNSRTIEGKISPLGTRVRVKAYEGTCATRVGLGLRPGRVISQMRIHAERDTAAT